MWKSLIYAIRTIRQGPVIATVAILSLALGIGSNTGIFSLLEQIVLRSLPVSDPESLTVLHREFSPSGTSSSDNSESVFSYPMYRDLRDRDTAFSGMVARMGAPVRVLYQENRSAAAAELVSGNFFLTTGVGAAIGRVLAPEDDRSPGTHPVAILGHAYWETQFASSPAVLNQNLMINGVPFVIVGVTESRFKGLIQGQAVDVFVPIAMQRAIIPSFDALENRSVRWLNLFARLQPSETLRHAQAATDVVYRSILEIEVASAAGVTARERDRFINHRIQLRPAAHGVSALRDKWEKPMAVLMSMVGLVLLIACANVAGLLIARATGRQREIAIRLALGASRGALIRQLLFEGLVLAVAGGAVGLLFAHWTTTVLLGLLPKGAVGGWVMTGLNLRLLGFALALSVVSGLLFALMPAIQSTRPDLASALRGRRGGITTHRRIASFRHVLVTGQIALSMLLVAVAGLFWVSSRSLLSADLGFRSERLFMLPVNVTWSKSSVPAAVSFYRDLQDRLEALPQVTGVASAIGGPFSGSNRGGNITIEDYRPHEEEYVGASLIAVSPGYFREMGIPIRSGREFTDRDSANSPKAVVVNDTFVRRYFGQSSAIGKRLMFGASNPSALDKEIVGVVADCRSDPRAPINPTVYYPYMQWEKAERMVYYVRIAGEGRLLAPEIGKAVLSADPNLPVTSIRSVEMHIRDLHYTDRLVAILSGVFGCLATALATIGLYALMAYAVGRRTAEIGVRMALGALPVDVLHMILREAGAMAGIGIIIGLGAALALSRLLSSQLFGVKPVDPVIMTGSAAMLILVVLAAAFLPAWKASRVEPLSALKYE